jgi:hypothetical protein
MGELERKEWNYKCTLNVFAHMKEQHRVSRRKLSEIKVKPEICSSEWMNGRRGGCVQYTLLLF